MGLAITCNRGPDTYIGDSRPRLAVYIDAHQVNPGQRYTTALELHDGSWRAQLARQFLPVQYPASDYFNKLTQTIDAINAVRISGADRLAQVLDANADKQRNLLITLSVLQTVLLIAAVWLALLFVRSITQPLRRAVDFLDTLEQGEAAPTAPHDHG